ncbi:MAG: type II toxin-antitoxin system VapC family toxin [Bacteroidetes bacterium]|nr:type II toxin-antitoxin system VapC family toxin [Bacteroidota bacterium]
MPPKILVDTDILSYYLKGYPDVVQELDDHEKQHDAVFISRITVVEILGGLKAKNATSQEARFREFINARTILEIDEATGEIASDIFAHLYQTGRHSGNYDIFIAATALQHQMTLCTNNLKDYSHIPGLGVVNWRKV